MPIIFRYKGFEFRFWCSSEEERPHVHAIKNNETNVKIWLEPEISVASVKGRINKSMLNELLQEVRRNEQLCRNTWAEYFEE